MRVALVLMIVLGEVAACAPAVVVHDAGDVVDPDACDQNIDCAQGEVCFRADAGDALGTCTRVTCTDDSCSDDERCDLRRGICVPAESDCTSAVDCPPDHICSFLSGPGWCIYVGAPVGADACRFAATRILARSGTAPRIDVVGTNSTGGPVPFSVFTTSSPLLDADGIARCDGPAPCRGVVVAAADHGDAKCRTSILVVPAVPAAALLVAAYDLESGAPLVGARVVVRKGGTGVEGVTDADGLASFTVEAPDDVTVAAGDHGRTTIVAPTSRALAVGAPLVVDPSLRAGAQGTVSFDDVHTQGDIRMAIAGLSAARAVAAPTPASLLGPGGLVSVAIEGTTSGTTHLDLPSSSVLELGTTPIKGSFEVLGAPGPRLVWAIGGKVRLAEIGPMISEATTTPPADDVFLFGVAPYFQRFDHVVAGPVDVVARPRGAPLPLTGGGGFVALDTLLSQSFTAAVPLLPSAGVVGVVGVDAPAFGFVPLGFATGLDVADDPRARDDGVVDWPADVTQIFPQRGELVVDWAPPHDGLEGSPLVAMLFAIDPPRFRDEDAPVSALVRVAASFSSQSPTVFDAFLAAPTATFDGKDGVVDVAAPPDADVVAIDVVNDDGEDGDRTWRILAPSTTTRVGIAALDGGPWSPSASVRVRVTAYRLDPRVGCPATYDDVVELGGGDALETCAEAWSRVTCAAGASTCAP